MQVFSHSFRQAKNKDYARPSEIYDLFLVDQDTPDTETLHFANWYETISFFDYPDGNAAQYLPLGISRGKIEATSNLEIDSLQLQLDNVDKALASLAASYDLRDKRVVARLVFRNLLSSPNDAKVLFDGTISDVMFPQGKLVVKVVSKLGDLSIETGWPYQNRCNTQFGDTYCSVNKESAVNKKSGMAEAGGSTTTLIDSANRTEGANYWAHGYIYFISGLNIGHKRLIVDYAWSTGTLTFDYALPNAVANGDRYFIYRGCDKTVDTCKNTYSNNARYRGFHTITLRANLPDRPALAD